MAYPGPLRLETHSGHRLGAACALDALLADPLLGDDDRMPRGLLEALTDDALLDAPRPASDADVGRVRSVLEAAAADRCGAA